MTSTQNAAGSAWLACVPHVPFIALQQRSENAPFWAAYEARAAALRAFDPDLVFVFGADHYSGQHLRLMPGFVIGQAAEALDDDGGYPGKLDVPLDLSLALAEYLIEREFDVATSYAMEVDHGFSNVIHNFLGEVDAKPVIPIFVNSLCHPRPTLKRCRKLGEAIGQFAAGLGKKVAFLGSGGLSHETGEIFPQYAEAETNRVRDYIVHGGAKGELTRDAWNSELHEGLQIVNAMLIDRVPGVGEVRPEWDDRFIETFAKGDFTAFDSWSDAEVLAKGGNGAGEVRQWIAAAAAAQAAGAGKIVIDLYEHGHGMGVASVVVHA
jgi:2,3-dihydroxyphenylpropionate 1,2-dioxygenase